MKQKTHKALAKRVTITKTGKVMKRHCGQDHFNSRATGKITRKKRRDTQLSGAHSVAIKNLLPNN
ncbi:MAG: 50S ribosomal protein L35 [Patescibacteria group bacterium]